MGDSDLAGGSRWSSQPGKSAASELEGISSSGSRIRVQDISEVFKEGSDSNKTFKTMRSMSKSMNKSLNNVSAADRAGSSPAVSGFSGLLCDLTHQELPLQVWPYCSWLVAAHGTGSGPC